jgi:hypothetical protein
MRCRFPMNQIIGTQDDAARHKMHGCADHVIRILYPDNIRIGVIRENDGILHMPISFPETVIGTAIVARENGAVNYLLSRVAADFFNAEIIFNFSKCS